MKSETEKTEKLLEEMIKAFLCIVKVYKINTDFYQNRSNIHIAT